MTTWWEADDQSIRQSLRGRLDARVLDPEPPAGLGNLPEVPPELEAEILQGRCIAFVGAGFSAAAKLPLWSRLLMDVAARASMSPAASQHVGHLVRRGSAHSLDQAAQFLQDRLGRDRFISLVHDSMRPELNEQTLRRLWYLLRIPFRAILTTNFDEILPGMAANEQAFRRVLRRPWSGGWDEAFWGDVAPVHVVKLHGDLGADHGSERRVVLTREDYRARIYKEAAYSTFLKAVLATNTVLYLGFSFEDAYLTELRSEVLSTLGPPPDGHPYGYAVLPNVGAETTGYFEDHEGMEVLGYPAAADEQPPFQGLDRYLESIYRRTNALPRFASVISGRRILWVDPHHAENNEAGMDFLRRAFRLSEEGASLHLVRSAGEALGLLGRSEAGTHSIVVTHWGQAEGTAERLLQGIGACSDRPPVVIFSTFSERETRGRRALALGATAYCHSWEGLFSECARLLEGSAR